MPTNWKKFFLIVGGFVMVVLLSGIINFWGSAQESDATPGAPAPQPEEIDTSTFDLAAYDNATATINTDKGDIVFTLFPDKAPKTVENFVRLAESGYYDGLTFHRSDANVIQGGDPLGNGTGGESIWGDKFADEPVQGDYVAGCVAMANSGPDTNGSQFFICKEDWLELPKSYNLYGQVTAGMEVVRSIEIGDVMNSVTITKQAD